MHKMQVIKLGVAMAELRYLERLTVGTLKEIR